jgi:hypothetical protein
VAVFELGRSRIARQANTLSRASAAYRQHGTRQRAVLELIRNCLVLIGIGIGIMTLRVILLLTHGVLS